VQIWTGAVEAVQGTNRLRTRLLRVYHAPKPGGGDRMGQWGEAVRMVAEGDVFFVTPESVAKGDLGVYDLSRDTVTMTGSVILTRGESVLRGDKLVINTVTGLATMDSVAQGRGKERVRGVFYPEDRAAAPAPAPAPPPQPAATTPARAADAASRPNRGAGTGRARPPAARPAVEAPATPAARDR
jgi:lipopolysaccharide export system protein LptA